jgi:hypothetical protein
VALVVGDANKPSNGDDDLRNFLEDLDFDVDVADDQDDSRDFRDDGLVVISSSVNANNLKDEWDNVDQPVVVLKADSFKDMEMTGDGNNDSGTQNARDIEIENRKHPLAAGLQGRINIARNDSKLNFGDPGPDAEIIATIDGDVGQAAIFAYDIGKELVNNDNNGNRNRGRAARHRRVGFFANADLTNDLEDEGQLLLEAAFMWAWQGSFDPGNSVN